MSAPINPSDRPVDELPAQLGSGEPPMERFVVDLSLYESELDPELAERLVPQLAETARAAAAAGAFLVDADGGGRWFSIPRGVSWARSRLLGRTAVIGVVMSLLGGGVAAAAGGNLPAPAQSVASDFVGAVGIDIPSAPADLPAIAEENRAKAVAFTAAVEDAVEAYTVALDEWTDCVAANAGSRGQTQRDPETRVTGPFDPSAGCNEKPALDIPAPANFGFGRSQRPEDAGRPDEPGRSGESNRP